MSWQSLEPIVRAAPRVKASVGVFSKLGVRLTVSFSDSFYRELGEPTKANCEAGSGENAGKLRLTFATSGKFDIVENAKGGGRVFLPAFAGVPLEESEGEPCAIEASSKSELIVSLPLTAWAAARAKVEGAMARVARSPAHVEAGAQIARVAGSVPRAKKIDAVKYLAGKGHGAGKRRDGTYAVDGEVLSPRQVLDLINQHRDKADLPLLETVEEIE